MGTAEERERQPRGWKEQWAEKFESQVQALESWAPLSHYKCFFRVNHCLRSWSPGGVPSECNNKALRPWGKFNKDGGNVNFQSSSHWCWLRYDWGWGQKGQDLYRLCTLWHTGVLRHNSKPDCLSPSEETHLVKFLLSEDLTLEAWIKEFEALCQVFDLGWKDITTTRDKDPAGHHSVSLS